PGALFVRRLPGEPFFVPFPGSSQTGPFAAPWARYLPVLAGPVGERRPQRGHIVRAEAEGREDRVAPAVQAAGGVGEVAVFQAGIEAAGEADRVVDAVALQRRGRVDVVTGLGPARER